MSRILRATYRVQMRKEFPLAAARELVPYLDQLGVSHLYLSPILAAHSGSAHGYDVIDPARLNPELGTVEDLRGLADDLHARDMGIILDIVPNHMSASEENPYWDNVLERGRESRYAHWFDVDWDAPRARGKVALPVLGDELDAVLERGEITVRIRESGARIAYFDRTFPLDPATLPQEVQLAQFDPEGRKAAEEWVAGPQGRERLERLLRRQHYRLMFWRRTSEQNYRRFFDVNDLVATRMDSDAVFDETHRLILDWVSEGILDGVRVDHIDGLAAPQWYLARLRESVDARRHADAPDPFPVFVEKILSGDEQLVPTWPVDGTTGYDFMNEVEDIFIDAAGFEQIKAAYASLRKNTDAFESIAHEGKRRFLRGPLSPDVMRAARLAREWNDEDTLTQRDIADAIVELFVGLGVYRTYVDEPGVVREEDIALLRKALAHARASGVNEDAVQLLEDAFCDPPDAADNVRAELVQRLQQTSGPATAKGIEDTALYVYVPLASRNEVGGEPARPLENAHERLHSANSHRAARWSRAMLATNTHDTKRSGDVRSRLNALTVIPDEWRRHVLRWRRLNRPRRTVVRGKLTPDTNAEYLYYQSILGLWPAPIPERRADDLPGTEWLDAVASRLTQYMLKAAREAKVRTSWTDGDPEYEKALTTFVSGTLELARDSEDFFLPDLARLSFLTAPTGFAMSLARLVIQLTAPGVPDVYQGNELWSFNLVDPDNRAPVDYERRRALLDELRHESALQDRLSSTRFFEDAAKLAVLHRLLLLRRSMPEIFLRGDYSALRPDTAGSSGTHPCFAFSRVLGSDCLITAVRTDFSSQGTLEGRIRIDAKARQWRSVFTGQEPPSSVSGEETVFAVSDLVGGSRPFEVLVGSNS